MDQADERQEVERILAELGQDAEQVHATLVEAGRLAFGERKAVQGSPISHYIEIELPEAMVHTVDTYYDRVIVVMRRWRTPDGKPCVRQWPAGGTYTSVEDYTVCAAEEVPVPPAVEDFLRRFDQGAYPELDMMIRCHDRPENEEELAALSPGELAALYSRYR